MADMCVAVQCKLGDLDLAQNGDGRFKGNWHAVSSLLTDSYLLTQYDQSEEAVGRRTMQNTGTVLVSIHSTAALRHAFLLLSLRGLVLSLETLHRPAD